MTATPAVHAIAPACQGSQLRGRFAVIPGSAGAGNIVYKLTLTNVSWAPCAVSGLPRARLLDRARRALPTHVVAAKPGARTSAVLTLRHGGRAFATARFSPDVTGPGETGPQCEPRAYFLRVLGRTIAIVPPTPVCEHGQLQFTPYAR